MAFPRVDIRRIVRKGKHPIVCIIIILVVLFWFYISGEENVIDNRINFYSSDKVSKASLQTERVVVHVWPPPLAQRQGKAHYDPDSKIKITERKFVESENKDLFILGAVAKNSTPTKVWDKIAMYGQWKNYQDVNVENLRCCFSYDNGKILESNVAEYNIKGDANYQPMLKAEFLVLWHIICDRPSIFPEGVSITRSMSCNNSLISYLEPYYAMKQPDGYLVITTKLAYETMDPEIMVGFFEAAKYLGVNKVITYVYKTLDKRAKQILKYYAQVGLLDYHTIELADEQGVPRKFPPLHGQYMNDEWIVKRDVLERNIGSTYFAIFDMDEYLIPSFSRSLQQLLTDLRQTYPQASHFHFKNVHYLTNEMTSSNGSLFQRHVMTSPERYNLIHQKMLIITERVDTKTINNHFVQPLNGFSEIIVEESQAYTRHYGKCDRKFKKKVCNDKAHLIKDTSMIHWAEGTINVSIQNTLKLFNLTIPIVD